MLTIVCHKRPENLEQFLVDTLKQRKEHGSRSIVYSEVELQNIFQLYDLKSENYITQAQCVEALKSLANSEFHYQQVEKADIPDKVDLYTFIKKCDEVLGTKPK